MRCYKVEAPGVVVAKSADKLPRGWSPTVEDAYAEAIAIGLEDQANAATAAALAAAAERVRRLREAMVREVLGQ